MGKPFTEAAFDRMNGVLFSGNDHATGTESLASLREELLAQGYTRIDFTRLVMQCGRDHADLQMMDQKLEEISYDR